MISSRSGKPSNTKSTVRRAGVSPDDVGDVILGCVLQAGVGMNVARQAAMARETELGLGPIRSGETLAGAARFAGGEGRGGVGVDPAPAVPPPIPPVDEEPRS